ncbi:hypothetical protein C5167_031670 [Papaver somniferum]|uniref:Uncharacterized protein n=1 Tax=Papaver somniferum TaxID=3469 RepID=A0A4Y7K4Z9_PAPSO|nr:hypothetical protein C5167_031670 [Papaver somniferum]
MDAKGSMICTVGKKRRCYENSELGFEISEEEKGIPLSHEDLMVIRVVYIDSREIKEASESFSSIMSWVGVVFVFGKDLLDVRKMGSCCVCCSFSQRNQIKVSLKWHAYVYTG